MKFIITENPKEWGKLQRQNKLKGMAQETIVCETLKKKITDPVHHEESIKKIVETINKAHQNCTFPLKKVKINGFVYSPRISSKKNEYALPIIDNNVLEAINTVEIEQEIEKTNTFQKQETCPMVWNGNQTRVCSKCGQTIIDSKTKIKKCRSCGTGYFRKCVTKKMVNKERKRKEFDWTIVIKNAPPDETIIKMKELGLAKKRVECVSKSRVDTWYLSGQDLFIFESKNKEMTGVSFGDVGQTIYYCKILKDAELISKATIIYNGSVHDKVIEYLILLGEKYNQDIQLQSIHEFLTNENIKIQGLFVNDNGLGVRMSKKGKYFLETVTGENNGKIMLKPNFEVENEWVSNQ